jgi:hypothetical protein
MELTAVNLSRSRKLWPRTANLRRESCDWAQLRNFRSHMSSSGPLSALSAVSHMMHWKSPWPPYPRHIHQQEPADYSPEDTSQHTKRGVSLSAQNGGGGKNRISFLFSRPASCLRPRDGSATADSSRSP